MRYPLGDGVLLVRGDRSFLLAGRALSPFPLYIERFDGESCQQVLADDLVCVSAPEGGETEPARMLLELVRRYRMPLLVLPRGHPGSGRLPLVVSVAPSIRLSCDIRRGTHPEQHLLCSSDELAGICLTGSGGGISVEGLPPGVSVSFLDGRAGDPIPD